MLGHCGVDQLFQNQSVAADVPLGLQAKTGMGLANGPYALGVLLTELTLGDNAPVVGLTALGAGHVAVILEEPLDRRRLPDLSVEDVEGRADGLGDKPPQSPEPLDGGGVKANEIKPLLHL